MKEILGQLRRWQRAGKRFALATVVRVERSAPRGPGATMAVAADGEVAGSVSGGCIEGALCEEAQGVLSTGQPKLVAYGISDELGFSVGLSCGGTVHVFLNERPVPEQVLEAVGSGQPVALATVLRGASIGAQLGLVPEGQIGHIADAELESAVIDDARQLLSRGENALRTYEQAEVFIQTFTPPPDMYIFGAVDFSAALSRVGKFLGYRVTVCDPRPVFATRERFPDADEVVISWPDEFLRRAPIRPTTAICVLAHEPKFDVPALKYALTTEAGYIGVMGSRRTQAERASRLREEGCTEEQLARLHAPIGLDIGSKTPQETAISIAAEVIATMRGA